MTTHDNFKTACPLLSRIPLLNRLFYRWFERAYERQKTQNAKLIASLQGLLRR